MEYLVSALEMRELDRQTIEELRVPGRVLMEVAGRGVAEACTRHAEPGARVVVACGTGNNGGDGFVVARALADQGYEVHTFIFGAKEKIKADAASALEPVERLHSDTISMVNDAKSMFDFAIALAESDLAVDALLGTGLSKEVVGLLGETIDVLNDSECPVVAVDIPSGVHSDTGAVLGRAVQCIETVTFAFAKRGHYLYPGAELRGGLTVVDIGIPDQLAENLSVVGRVLTPGDGRFMLPQRPPAAHKGHFGHVVVLAGSAAFPGAAVLAQQGALSAGAGLVSWAAEKATVASAPPRPAEVMLRTPRDGEALDAWAARLLEGATALVVGPGLTTEPHRAAELAAVLGRCSVPICMDADALNLLAADPTLWDRVEAPLVITPHPREMARLTGLEVSAIQADRFAAAIELSLARSCVVLLKGAATVVADPAGQVAVCAAGNPGMATGGTGDVLAGIVGGLLAQGIEPAQAARAGALLHAAAGDEAARVRGETGLRAGDLLDAMGTVLASWQR
jgi:NAD(P)H-hydrate epimerase